MGEMMSIRDAAKQIRWSKERLRAFIDSGHCPAYRNGGSERHPRLCVRMEELQAAIDRHTVYIPPTQRKRRASSKSVTLDPVAAAL